MTDDNDTPCIRGCTWPPTMPGEEPKPKVAKGDRLICNSCYHRLRHALELIPDLMANMRMQMMPNLVSNYQSERVSGGGDGAPLPFRTSVLDASDSLYAKLVSWTEVISGALHVAQPKAAVWINFKEAQGSKVVTPIRARELAADLSDWFLDRLDAIAELEVFVALHDDICYGWSEAKGVFALSAVYGVEPKPLRQQDKRECPVCGKVDVFAKPPDLLDPEWSVLCANCHWVAEPSLYGHYAAMFEDEAS